MGSGKTKIEIKKITKESSRMVTFSKRRKGLFKKAQDFHSKTGANIAILVFSPAGRPYVYGDPTSAVNTLLNGSRNGFEGTSTSPGSTSHDETGNDNGLIRFLNGSPSGLEGTSTPPGSTSRDETGNDNGLIRFLIGSPNGLEGISTPPVSTSHDETGSDNGLIRQWLDNINIEGCNQVDGLMVLKQQLLEMKKRTGFFPSP